MLYSTHGLSKGSQLSQKAVPEQAEMSLDKTTRRAAGQPFWGMPHWAMIRHCGPSKWAQVWASWLLTCLRAVGKRSLYLILHVRLVHFQLTSLNRIQLLKEQDDFSHKHSSLWEEKCAWVDDILNCFSNYCMICFVHYMYVWVKNVYRTIQKE